MPCSHPIRYLAAALLASSALSSLPAAAQIRVGVNTAVNPDAVGTAPGSVPRQLRLGQQIVYNERVATSTVGQTQIAFVDESSLSVGPNSDMVIDRFVYDPRTTTGMLAANATRGVFRYVGGRISKQADAVNIRTPSAMVGIRGGIFLLDIKPNGGLDAIFVYGVGLTVTGLNGVTQVASRPGYEISVAAPGASPSAPYPAPAGASAAMLARLDGHPGMYGGATRIPTDALAARGSPVPPPYLAQTQPDYGGLPPIFLTGPVGRGQAPQPPINPVGSNSIGSNSIGSNSVGSNSVGSNPFGGGVVSRPGR